MYTSTYPPSASPYASPPQPPHDPYRSSPISVNPKQPYNTAFSPPPQIPNAFSPVNGPMSSSQSQRYQQYPNPQPQQYARGPPNRYASPAQVPGYPNGAGPGPGYAQQAPSPHLPQRHKGTLAPGQIVKIGEIAVRIERYLSEGGYAHVYLTSSEKPVYPPNKGSEKKGRWGEKGYTEHCLKRIAFEDDNVWIDVKKEIEVMKSLPPNPHLIQYLGSTHSRLPTGGHEVFILMEYCSGGGIIDLLNKRLRDRLKEIEILNIFTDVCEAVAAMHHLSRPLLHRDLKIENVLSQPLSTSPSPQRPSPLMFKLCDFGSTTFPADKPPQSKVEADALAMDLNKNTTLQYRSPEMVEPMLGLPVGLPSDVWALGCLLYKLCYYTTPFEEHGPLAIVNAKYSFPPVPAYSPRIQHLIASMLVEQPVRRPTVFEILKVAHEMSGTKPEIDYPIPSRSLNAPAQQRQPTRSQAPSSNLLDFTGSSSPTDKTPVMQPTLASTVQPQRRGRPSREPSQKQVLQTSTPTAMPPPPAQPQAITSSTSQSHPPKMQVTGEAPSSLSKGSSPGLDAFGMPSLPASLSQKSGNRGFGDSFAAPKPAALTGGSRFGANLPRPPSGFGDSFGSSKSPSLPSRSPTISSLNRAPSSSSKQSVPQQSSPAISANRPKSPKTSKPSSGHKSDLSFETRFPSIETLDSDAFSPPPTEAQGPERLISPVSMPSPTVRPTFRAKQSVMGNMTGGDLKSPTTTTAPINSGPPQPRSTNVTGTAFKTVKSPSSPNQKTDYFGAISNSSNLPKSPQAVPHISEAKSPIPQDLMGDEDSSLLGLPSIQPGRSTTPSSASGNLSAIPLISPGFANIQAQPSPGISAKVAPTTGHHRSLLPNIDSTKPTSNFNSAEWSPLERMKSGSTPSTAAEERKVEIELDSSDEEVVPESASGMSRRPISPEKFSSPQKVSQRASVFGGVPHKSATTDSARPSTGSQRGVSGERSRPQSMFITPSSSSSNKPHNSPSTVSEEPLGLPKDASRPSHTRKGSITDMVSRYENLKPPSSVKPTSTSIDQHANGNDSNGVGRKPSVANKPPALRKPSQGETPNVTSPADLAKPKIAVKPKPNIIAPKPIRHSEAPIAEGFSKSSSGRSFPITKPKPSSMNTNNSIPADTDHSESATTPKSGKNSPEKQQPVNLLIQRWNQGQVNNNSTAKGSPKKGGYI
ncbi:uncharacterized protein IL334_004221 [Kwoniella shivajii]|uniref:non-specific serine/threonine protein kinase n=1 Tax=Kwoniella shivajii TaxID=564305 RepID=A0ABZ1CZR1_9TREE|nr:hypothetical protein IL334_004221 [Kwoniella shivajii]